MLSGQRNNVPINASGADKEFSMIMESIERILELIERISCNGVATCNLAEVKKCGEAFDNLCGDVASDGSKVDLHEPTRLLVWAFIHSA
jgi:hypothetical protein